MAKITRVYDTHQKASDAVNDLKENGFYEDHITLDSPPPPAVGQEETAPARHVVSVNPPFGSAAAATQILDKHGPLPEEAPSTPAATTTALAKTTTTHPSVIDDPAPLSTALGLPVLLPFHTSAKLERDPTPLSTKLGWSVLKSDAPKASLLPEWSMSDKFGWKLLSSDPAPLSTAIGHNVLSDDPAPLSSKAGWRVLTNDPTPLSTKLGWKVLSDRQ